MGVSVGIDLGTTNSVVAVCTGPRPKVLINRESKPLTPSMVSYKEKSGEFIVGALSYIYWDFDPKNTIYSVKRLMGQSFSDLQVQRAREAVYYEIVEPSDGTRDSLRVILGGKEYSPVDISAMILRKLKEDAEYHLNEEVTHAVVTVPAYFSQIQRDATRRAVLQAGMKVIKILDEPTAAAIAYGLDSSDSKGVKTILVYDLGGGTFDISVLLLAGSVFSHLDLEGDMWLGGDDFDQLLVDYAVKHIKREYGADPTSDVKVMIKLKKVAREAKEALSSSNKADLISPGFMQDDSGNFIDLDLQVTRGQYQEMISPLVKKTVALVEKAIENAKGVDISKIDYVLMAGNATMTPLVQQAMEEMFGRDRIMREDNPKLMVALGAAVFATIIGDFVFCPNPDPDNPKKECGHRNPKDATECERCHGPLELIKEIKPGGRAPFNYGVLSTGDKFNIFIPKNEPYPTQNPKPQDFHTLRDNQPMISIPVYGGENMEKASENEKQGEAFAILPRGLPKDTLVRITISLDDDGVFKVAAELGDGTDLHPWITHGDIDARVINIMEEVERIIADKASDISPEEKEGLDQQERAAWDKMSQGKFEEARDEANKLMKMAEEIGRKPPDLKEKAENLIGFTGFILQQYGWAFKTKDISRLSRLAEETESVLKSEDMKELEQKVNELDKATDELPDVVKLLFGLRGAIVRHISPFDIALAKKFSEELEEVESGLKSGKLAAVEKLGDLALRIAKKFPARRCSQGHLVPKGERICPECGEDTLWGIKTGEAV